MATGIAALVFFFCHCVFISLWPKSRVGLICKTLSRPVSWKLNPPLPPKQPIPASENLSSGHFLTDCLIFLLKAYTVLRKKIFLFMARRQEGTIGRKSKKNACGSNHTALLWRMLFRSFQVTMEAGREERPVVQNNNNTKDMDMDCAASRKAKM